MTSPNKLKLLVICSRNQWRSPTAERIYRNDPRVEVRSAGTSEKAVHKVSIKDIEWAEMILCMEVKHQDFLQKKFFGIKLPPIKVLNIPDEYDYMDPELIKMLKGEVENLLVK